MSRWRRQRGEITPGCIFSLIFLLLVVVVALKAVPAMMTVGEFEREVDKLADRANRTDYPPKRIHRMLYEKAEELRLPLGPKDIEVKKTSKHVTIKVEYDLEVDLIVYTYVWHKEHEEVRPLF